MPGYVVPIMVTALVAVAIGGLVFVIFRLRTGQGLSISWRSLFLVYFYLMTVISLLVMVGGLSNLVRVGLGAVLGKEFSYYSPSVYELRKPPPPVRVGERVPTPEEAQELTPEEQQAERQKALDRNFREGLFNGLSFTIVGGLIWAVHLYGRRRLEREEEVEWLHRLYMIALLLTFGILTLTSLPEAVFDTLRYYLIEADQGYFRRPPAERLSTGIVALPLWLYYLWGTFRLVRGKTGEA